MITGPHHMSEHRHDAVIEDVQFLLDTGLSFEAACKRVDRTESAVEKLFLRRGLPNPANREANA